MIYRLMLIAFLTASTASALETSAGTDTVNASQIGLAAKIDASNAALLSVINNILACNRANEMYDSISKTCAPARAADSEVQAILNCAHNNQLYDFATKTCKPTRAADSDLQAILYCNHNKQFYDSVTKACTPVAGKTLKLVKTYNTGYVKGVKLGPSSADLCLLSMTRVGSADNFSAGCEVTGGPGAWKLVGTQTGRSNEQCKMACYNWQ